MASASKRFLKPEEISLFCEQVGMVLDAGIPLCDGMESLSQSYAGEAHGTQFQKINETVLQNGSLSDALGQSGLFPPYLVAMTRIGERTGKLDDVMNALAQYYHWEAELAVSVKNAIVYPLVLILMLAAVITILVISVLPVFARVFAGLGLGTASNPGAFMRFGMGLGNIVLVVVGIFLVLLIVLALLLRSGKREQVLERLSTLLPFVRGAREKIAMSRLADVFSIMLTAGYPIETAMELVPDVVSDIAYRKKLDACKREMDDGKSFVPALIDAGLFSQMHEKMISFGAAAGQLDNVMEKLSGIYREEADRTLSRLVSLIEPTLVSVLTLVIGGILLSVTLPLLSILSAIG